MNKYRLVAKKGEGTFSEVLKAQSIKSGRYVAIKCMKNNFDSLDQVNNLREIQALRRLSPHPHIIKLLEVLYDQPTGRLALVFELMDMNIYELIRGRRHYVADERVRGYMYQLMKALDHMHRNGIFHRDIKPENILIMDDVLKLADLGSCRGIYSKQPYTEYISTRWYRAPECLLTDGYYSYKMDMWGVGCVMFEIVALYPLFPGNNELDQIQKIHAIIGTPPPELLGRLKKRSSHSSPFDFPALEGSGLAKLLAHVPPDCADLIAKLLAYNPDERLSARQALHHPYFREPREADKRAKAALQSDGKGGGFLSAMECEAQLQQAGGPAGAAASLSEVTGLPLAGLPHFPGAEQQHARAAASGPSSVRQAAVAAAAAAATGLLDHAGAAAAGTAGVAAAVAAAAAAGAGSQPSMHMLPAIAGSSIKPSQHLHAQLPVHHQHSHQHSHSQHHHHPQQQQQHQEPQMLQQQHSLQQPLHHHPQQQQQQQQQQQRQGSLHLDGLHGHQLLGHAGPGSVGGSSMRDRGERDSTLLQLMAEGSSLSQAALHMPGLGLQASVGSQLWHESSGAVGQGVVGQLLPPLVSKASSMGHHQLGRRISHMGQQATNRHHQQQLQQQPLHQQQRSLGGAGSSSMKAAAHGHLPMQQHTASLSSKAGLQLHEQQHHLQHQLQGRAGHSGIQISSARAHKQGSSSSLLQAAGSLANSMSDLSSLQLGAGSMKFVRAAAAAAKCGGGGGALASSPSKRQLPGQAYVSPYSQRR